jgi:predicted phosphate transport protein (TIGR00153 family)
MGGKINGKIKEIQRAVLRRLIPRQVDFFDRFDAQVNMLARAGCLLDAARLERRVTPETAKTMKQYEEECDRITHGILVELMEAFITPIDREDIYALATANDDIMDFLEEAALKMADYGILFDHHLSGFVEILVKAIRELRSSVNYLRSFDPRFAASEKEVKALENEADALERRVIAESYTLESLDALRSKDETGICLTAGELTAVFGEYNRRRQRREIAEIFECAVDSTKRSIVLIGNIYIKFA